MYPWLGQIPGLQQGGQQDPMALIRQLLAARGGMGGGFQMPMGMGQPQQLDWSNPQAALAQLQQRFTNRFTDNRGLSGLWSSASPTTTGPGGWNTTVTQGQGGGLIGGLLGRLFR